MKEIIKNVGKKLKEAVNYRFLRWRGDPEYPYFIGELYGDGGGDESGESEYSFLITGFYRGDNEICLYEAAEKIIEIFPEDTGCLIGCRDGGMLVSFDSMNGDVPDMDTELAKIQITLKVKRWKGKGQWQKGNGLTNLKNQRLPRLRQKKCLLMPQSCMQT